MNNLARWEPFREMENFLQRYSPLSRRTQAGEEDTWAPASDISETDTEYLVKAELPEVKKEDIKISLDNDVLTIRGERKREKQHASKNELRVERYYGAFSRSFSLPSNVDANRIRAESRDGVLRVHIPKNAQAQPKSIPINVQ